MSDDLDPPKDVNAVIREQVSYFQLIIYSLCKIWAKMSD